MAVGRVIRLCVTAVGRVIRLCVMNVGRVIRLCVMNVGRVNEGSLLFELNTFCSSCPHHDGSPDSTMFNCYFRLNIWKGDRNR